MPKVLKFILVYYTFFWLYPLHTWLYGMQKFFDLPTYASWSQTHARSKVFQT
jgi:hypothetical protein